MFLSADLQQAYFVFSQSFHKIRADIPIGNNQISFIVRGNISTFFHGLYWKRMF